MRTRVEAKDSTFKPGDHVVIQAGYGGKGGMAGQDFKRFSSDIAGGDIYVRPEGDNYKWKVQAKALVEGTAKASARDADRRSRLHRALDAVIDSCGAKARDAKPVSIISKAISVLNASYGFDTVGRKGDNVLVRKGYFYSNGGSEDKVADRAISTLAAAGIKARVMRTGDVWKPFKGGASIAAQSHWWVELRISEATK
jgi:signal peptidase I